MSDDSARETDDGPLKASNYIPVISAELRRLSLESHKAIAPMATIPQTRFRRASNNGIVSVDVTDRFRDAASSLDPGELVKNPFFTLFEAVGALEIMDPKMDSNCLPAEELQDADYNFSRPLLPEQTVGIIDQLLCLEMAWHTGYPLSQTIFTSVYIYALLTHVHASIANLDFVPERNSEQRMVAPSHVVLRAYCIGLIKTCQHVIDVVRNELYFEEEDFVTNTYNLSLLAEISHQEAYEELQAARALLLDTKQHEWPTEVIHALDVRLEFREAFLKATSEIHPSMSLDDLKAPWIRMRVAMERVEKSHVWGVAVPDAFNINLQRRLSSNMPPRPIIQPTFDKASENWLCFCKDGTDAVNVLNYGGSQSLLKFILMFQARKPQPLIFIRTLIQHFIFADQVILGHMSIRQLMDDDLALVVLPASAYLDPANDSDSSFDSDQDTKNPRAIVAHLMEEFRQRAFPLYLDLFRILCQNRSRARRMLCRTAQEWDRLQIEIEDIDQAVQVAMAGGSSTVSGAATMHQAPTAADPLPLSSWAYLYKLQILEWMVQFGFELEVYMVDELPGMYWYLGYVAKRRQQHTERIRGFVLRDLEMKQSHSQQQQQQQQASKKQNQNKKTPQGKESGKKAEQQDSNSDNNIISDGFKGSERDAFEGTLEFLRATVLDAAVTWKLADSLSCLYTVLQRTRVLPVPVRPFGSDELRYELRMRPFKAAGPAELPPFATYVEEVVHLEGSLQDILQYTSSTIMAVRREGDVLMRLDPIRAFSVSCPEQWRERTKNMLKAAIWASISVSSLIKALETAGFDRNCTRLADNEVLQFTKTKWTDNSCHEWWPVPT